jgi:hypothetical protein
MKVSPRCPERNPKERSLRGDRVLPRLTTSSTAADRRPEQGPEGEATQSGAVRQLAVGEDGQRQEGTGRRRGDSAWRWEQTPERRIPDVVVG